MKTRGKKTRKCFVKNSFGFCTKLFYKLLDIVKELCLNLRHQRRRTFGAHALTSLAVLAMIRHSIHIFVHTRRNRLHAICASVVKKFLIVLFFTVSLLPTQVCVSDSSVGLVPDPAPRRRDSLDDFLAQQYEHAALQVPVTFMKKHISLAHVLSYLASRAQISLFLDSKVDGELALVRVREETVGQVLHAILSGRSPPLAALMVGGTLHIGPRTTLLRRARVLLAGNRAKSTRAVVPINYLMWNEGLKLRLEAMWHHCTTEHVGPRRIQYFFIDDGGRRVTVQGTAAQVAQFQSVVGALDVPPPQVSLQARVIIARASCLSGLGLTAQAGYNVRAGGGTGFGFAGIGSIPGAALPWALHLVPGGAKSAATLELPLVFGGTDLSVRRLNMILTAAEQRSELRTLLAPHIVSVSGTQASLLEGQSVPIESVTEEVVEGRTRNVRSATYKEVGVQLKVKPYVLPNGKQVRLELLVEDSHLVPGHTPTSYPTITTSRVSNTVTMQSGQTVLLGGLVRSYAHHEERGVPFLRSLPLIGPLFTGTSEQREAQRLYIFVTATLV